MQKPIAIATRVEHATAMQFLGWRNAWAVAQWTGCVFFVPEGAESPFRRNTEMDRGNGHVKENAPAFLIFGRDQSYARVDILDWIVQDAFGLFKHVQVRAFGEIFDERED